MLRVTWEWLGQAPALDLANTVAVVDGLEHDLIASESEYGRWAAGEATFLPRGSSRLLERGRPELLRLRTCIRRLLGAISAGEPVQRRLAEVLNRSSRTAPRWLELDPAGPALRERTSGSAVDDLVAAYARSAMELAAGDADRLRRCPAPSCGMFFLRSRDAQRWCSTQCGTRARVAMHHDRHRRRVGS
jgi:predicted RNA-binding Zn ribbon-like protein